MNQNHVFKQEEMMLENCSQNQNPENQDNEWVKKSSIRRDPILQQQHSDTLPQLKDQQGQAKDTLSKFKVQLPKNFKSQSAQVTAQATGITNQSVCSFISKYRLNQSYFTKDQLLQQKHYTEITVSGEKAVKLQNQEPFTYYGGFQNQMMHGWGVLITKKFVYEGMFSLNNKNGKGYIRYLENNSKYYGDFSNDKPNGSGLLQYGEEFYMGDFENGSMNGDGMWKNEKGEKYIGRWKSNKAHGYGIYVTPSSHYQGQFRNFDKHGYGIENFINEDIFKGNYVNGKPQGYGQYFWKNGITYKGNFVEGLRQGYGTWRNQAGDQYQGNFQADHKSGYGEFKWINGNLYKGQFYEDMREGQGTMIWNDQSVYQGEWKKGLPNGKGIFKAKGQKVKHGFFQDNILVEEIRDTIQSKNQVNSIARKQNTQHKKGYVIKNMRKNDCKSQQKGSRIGRNAKLHVNASHAEKIRRNKSGLSQDNSGSNCRKGVGLNRTTGSAVIPNAKINSLKGMSFTFRID